MPPWKRSPGRTRLSLEPSSDSVENCPDPVDSGNRFVNDRGQLARANHVERTRQRFELVEDVEEPDGLRQQRQLVEPSAVLDRLGERVGMARPGIVRKACIDRELPQLED